MKNLLLLALVALVAACGGAPEGENVEAKDAMEAAPVAPTAATISIDTEASVINWVGAKFTGDQHMGTLKISEGELATSDGQLVGGKFVIDMTSMTNTDLPAEKQGNLIGHLSNGDFFEVDKFATAMFEITGVEAAAAGAGHSHNITGNLTMKDITKSVTIPTSVNTDNGFNATTPQFTIDRTEWGIQYGSTKAGALKDKAIQDEIGLSITLVGK